MARNGYHLPDYVANWDMVVAPGSTKVALYGAAHGFMRSGLNDGGEMVDRLVMEYHPDACPLLMKEESTRRCIEIRMAYETLSDPISREIYDHELSLVGAEGRRRLHGRYNKDNAEEFPGEVWERQLRELKKRSGQKMEKRIDKKM
ncbi:chaperone protein dnaJ 20, chloroplastic-like [Coffea eugenioides]|uniref:chaperone protein dnaJ 20, chloroplastic-like n=1 Tax=Coffea eugenioides TaxID=49369 RepID=UPI000F614420|nr:chaperone protein dnaJ 20, chloroplastic-like [Coffea eugenioides]